MRKRITWVGLALLGVTLAVAGSAAVASDDTGDIVPARPVTTSRIEPNYPPAALAARYEAAVILNVTVRKDGTLGDISVVESSRPKLGFEDAASAALEHWAFTPAMVDGEPVDSETYIRMNFRVPGTRSNPGAYVASGVLGSTPIFAATPGGWASDRRGGGLPPKPEPGVGSPDTTGHGKDVLLPRRPPCSTPGCIYHRADLLPRPEHLAQLPAPID